MKRVLLIMVAVVVSFTSNAQDSQTILNKLSEKAKGYTSIYAEYESRIVDKQNGIDESQSGKIKIQGEKYNLSLGNYTIITDGENIWSYSKDANECSLDLLEDMEDDAFDPGALFTIWENDYKHEYKNEVAVAGKKTYQINLYPNNPSDKPYHTIVLYIDKTAMEIVKIEMKGREGVDNTYLVKEFKPNYEMNSQDFNFQPGNYPGVEIIDNRI